MLNTFPELLNYAILAPTMIRFLLSFVLITTGVTMIKPSTRALFSAYFASKEYPLASFLPWKFATVQILLGIFLFFGFFTQISSLIAIYIFFSLFYIENRAEKILPHTSNFYLVMIIISMTLLFTGAGAFAVDLPL
jgi:uncharacterized membrane protein YphA (DoxX/SURF4 family)